MFQTLLIILFILLICCCISSWYMVHYIYAHHQYMRDQDQICITQLYCTGSPVGPSSKDQIPVIDCNYSKYTSFYKTPTPTSIGICSRQQFLNIKNGSDIYTLGFYEYDNTYNLSGQTGPAFFEGTDSGTCYYLHKDPTTFQPGHNSGFSSWFTDHWNQVIGVSVKKGLTPPALPPYLSEYQQVNSVISFEREYYTPENTNNFFNITQLEGYGCNLITAPLKEKNSNNGMSEYIAIYSSSQYFQEDFFTTSSGISIFLIDNNSGDFASSQTNEGTDLFNPVDLLVHTKQITSLCNPDPKNPTVADPNCFCIDPSLIPQTADGKKLFMEKAFVLPSNFDPGSTLLTNDSSINKINTYFIPDNKDEIDSNYNYENLKNRTYGNKPVHEDDNLTSTGSIQPRFLLLCGTSQIQPNDVNIGYKDLHYGTSAIESFSKYDKLDESCGDLSEDKCNLITFPK